MCLAASISVAHALNLLLVTDSLLKVSSITVVIKKCKDIVTALHFKCDMLEREVKDTNNEHMLPKCCSRRLMKFRG